MTRIASPLFIMRTCASWLLRHFGWDLVRIDSNFDPKTGSDILCLLKVLNKANADLLLDIGANRGEFAKQIIKAGFRGRIMCFEPLPECYQELEALAASNSQVKLAPRCALGRSRGTASLNVSANSVSSSVLPMRPSHLQVAPESAYIRTEAVEIYPLDYFADQMSDCRSICIKLDVQGFEREVIAGAAKLFDKVHAIQIELSATDFYEEQPLMSEMLDYFAKQDFELHAIFPVFIDPASGRQFQHDAIFVRRTG